MCFCMVTASHPHRNTLLSQIENRLIQWVQKDDIIPKQQRHYPLVTILDYYPSWLRLEILFINIVNRTGDKGQPWQRPTLTYIVKVCPTAGHANQTHTAGVQGHQPLSPNVRSAVVWKQRWAVHFTSKLSVASYIVLLYLIHLIIPSILSKFKNKCKFYDGF